jgi:hypothetical protein
MTCPTICGGWVDGSPVELEMKSSEEHIGYYDWKSDLRPFESEWNWYICPVTGGSHRINFKGTAGYGNPRFGLWLWTDSELKDITHLDSVHCSEPAMPQYCDRLERKGVCLISPKVML